jgi:hypothetical protein
MKRTLNHLAIESMRLLAGACVLIAILALAPMSVAQQSAAKAAASNSVASRTASTGVAAKTAAKPVTEEESAAPNSANQQGIKVHGHWVLQVKNADGTLGERREFENSLVTGQTNIGGDQLLASLISGNASVSDPIIAFIPTAPAAGADISNICNNNGWVNSTCYTFTTNTNSNTSILFANYAGGLTTTTNMTPNVNWVLAGNYAVPSGLTSITLVQTILPLCISMTNTIETYHPTGPTRTPPTNPFQGTSTTRTADLAPNACAIPFANPPANTDSVWFGILTSTAVASGGVATPLAVTPGQIVQVTVTISFS